MNGDASGHGIDLGEENGKWEPCAEMAAVLDAVGLLGDGPEKVQSKAHDLLRIREGKVSGR